MKLISTCMFLLLVAGRVLAADPVIEFRGVMAGDGPTKLSLVDKSNDITRWVEVGQTFVGFKVKGYDTAKETATLTKDGREYQIRLNTSKIIESEPAAAGNSAAAAAAAGKISNETALVIFNNLRQIAAASDQYYLEYGKNTVTLDELVGPTNYIKQLKSEAGEGYGGLKLRAGDVTLSVTTASGETVTYDQAGSASSFYRVSAGETIAQIAAKTGVPVSRLVELNQIDPAKLRVGQSLRTK